MRRLEPPDAVAVGAGPNGLAAAVTLARAGCSVLVLEAEDTPGGGCRSEELTPAGVRPRRLRRHPSPRRGVAGVRRPASRRPRLELVHPEAPATHPLPDGSAAVLERSLDATAERLGQDAGAWRRVVGPLVRDWDGLTASILGPMLRVSAHPLTMARVGIRALWPARALAARVFNGEAARGLFTGLAAHAILDLGKPLTASFGLAFAASAQPCVVGSSPTGGADPDTLRSFVSVVVSAGSRVAPVDACHTPLERRGERGPARWSGARHHGSVDLAAPSAGSGLPTLVTPKAPVGSEKGDRQRRSPTFSMDGQPMRRCRWRSTHIRVA